MPLTLEAIQTLEMSWDTLETAAFELEKRINNGSDDCETVTRLGFLCWYFVVKASCLSLEASTEKYANHFKNLLETYAHQHSSNPDFCLSSGSGVFGWWYFFGLKEEMANDC